MRFEPMVECRGHPTGWARLVTQLLPKLRQVRFHDPLVDVVNDVADYVVTDPGRHRLASGAGMGPRSAAAGLGPGCRARIRAAALSEALRAYTAEQISKALELIAGKGIVVSGVAGVFRTVSSDGTAYYLTAASGQCNCRAGLNGRRCRDCRPHVPGRLMYDDHSRCGSCGHPAVMECGCCCGWPLAPSQKFQPSQLPVTGTLPQDRTRATARNHLAICGRRRARALGSRLNDVQEATAELGDAIGLDLPVSIDRLGKSVSSQRAETCLGKSWIHRERVLHLLDRP